MNLTLFGSRNHFSVARFSSPCLRAWGPGVGSLSPPPCFLKQEGPGLSRASCKALSSWLDRAVCSCWVVLAIASGGVAYPGLSSSFPLSSWSMLAGSSLGMGVGVGSVYFPFAAGACTASSSEVESHLYWGDGG